MYETMTWEELDARRQELMVQRDTVLAEIKELMAVRNKMEADKSAQEVVAGMSDAQKEAMRQILSVQSVVNSSSVGSPHA